MTWGMDNVLEDMEVKEQCMPYHSYPIPRVPDLCVLISNYSKIKIDAEMTDMGFMGYGVTVFISAPQDSYDKTFTSPFLDDALAEALLELKKGSDDKGKMFEELKKTGMEKGGEPCPKYEGNYYCLGEKDCTHPDNRHECHPKG